MLRRRRRGHKLLLAAIVSLATMCNTFMAGYYGGVINEGTRYLTENIRENMESENGAEDDSSAEKEKGDKEQTAEKNRFASSRTEDSMLESIFGFLTNPQFRELLNQDKENESDDGGSLLLTEDGQGDGMLLDMADGSGGSVPDMDETDAISELELDGIEGIEADSETDALDEMNLEYQEDESDTVPETADDADYEEFFYEAEQEAATEYEEDEQDGVFYQSSDTSDNANEYSEAPESAMCEPEPDIPQSMPENDAWQEPVDTSFMNADEVIPKNIEQYDQVYPAQQGLPSQGDADYGDETGECSSSDE